MEKQPRHRPERTFPDAKRVIVPCELGQCVHCGSPLKSRKPWYVHKTVQTLGGPVFVAGRSKECVDPDCAHSGAHYYASGVLKISLPHSTYGLDVLAYLGWQHDKEHRQFVEIQRGLNERGILINERTVGKLYRQFLALLGGASEQTLRILATTAHAHGGLIWAIDALQPEGHGTLLYVLYEVSNGTPVAALQSDHPTAAELDAWLSPYAALPYRALATLSDGEDALVAALKQSWPQTPHQRCQAHVLGNIAEPVLQHDTELRQRLRDDLGGLPAVPEQGAGSTAPAPDQPPTAAMDVAERGPGPTSGDAAGLAPVPGSAAPLFYLSHGMLN